MFTVQSDLFILKMTGVTFKVGAHCQPQSCFKSRQICICVCCYQNRVRLSISLSSYVINRTLSKSLKVTLTTLRCMPVYTLDFIFKYVFDYAPCPFFNVGNRPTLATDREVLEALALNRPPR